MSDIGKRLTAPQEGWRRYDGNNKNIEYVKGFNDRQGYYREYYNNDNIHACEGEDGTMRFSFYGTKLRLYDNVYSNRTTTSTISFDGGKTFEKCSANGEDTPKAQVLYYEKTGLKKEVHDVIINCPNEESKCFIFDCFDIDNEGFLIEESAIIKISPVATSAFEGRTFAAELVIDNIKDIVAEDIKIGYDTDKLEFVTASESEKQKIAYSNLGDGQIRIVAVSKGKENIINEKSTIAVLKFRAKDVGHAIINVNSAIISDGIEMEKKLFDVECSYGVVDIDCSDINKDTKYTLLDLAEDGRYFGDKKPEESKNNTDKVVDEKDLEDITVNILSNTNYPHNK